jgi:hypothetical protein
MALNEHDQTRIREYLLDKLSDDEREKIEERLMVEDALFEELEILKGELVEEYREGELTGRDRESFEAGFLSSADGRQRQLFAVAIDALERHRQPQRVGFRLFQKARMGDSECRFSGCNNRGAHLDLDPSAAGKICRGNSNQQRGHTFD